jgi:drug/metabolite transporter (DMT)-like permease
MLYLPLTIFLSAFIVVTFKIFSRTGVNSKQAIVVNYLVAVLCGYFILGNDLKVSEIISQSWFPFAVLAGVTLILVFQVFALSTQKAGIAVTAVSSKMSLVIPVSIGLFLYGDHFNVLILFGIILSLVAFYLTFRKKGDKSHSKYFYLPLLLFIGNGCNDSLLKHTEKFYIGGQTLMFLTVAFSASFIIGLVIVAFGHFVKKEKLQFKSLTAGIWLGLLNWGATYFFLLGLKYYDSVVYFPIMNVSIVLISAIAGYVFFKEQLSRINILGISLAVLAIVLIAFA